MSSIDRRRVETILGVAVCAALSGVATLVFSSRTWRALVPLFFVVVIVALAQWFGSAAGIYGSLVAALIFAAFLFEPVPSIHIQSTAARANIGWMLLAGISLSYLLPGSRGTPHNKN